MKKRMQIAIVIILAMLSIMLITSCGSNVNLTNPDITDSTGLSIGTDETFDVVTWNIENFPKHNPETTQLLTQLIPKLHADCIAVQEVSNISSFFSLVSSLPGWSYRISGSGDTQTAIMYNTSTVQVDSSAALFGGMSNPFPRPPLLVKLHFNNQEIILISIHLKAYGDNVIDETDSYDEEVRRRYACQLLDQYIESNFSNSKVIVVGDMNDQIQEPASTNVFMSFIGKPAEYSFTDMTIAQHLNAQNCSYPKYSSHLDHIIISNELFSSFSSGGNFVKTIVMENFIAGGWTNYYNFISDHRPVCARFRL